MIRPLGAHAVECPERGGSGAGAVGERVWSPEGGRRDGGPAFDQVLGAHLPAPVRFSGHAQDRLASRQIALSTEEVRQLETALDLARQKGARDALVLLDRRAFIVSVPTATVVTAMRAGGSRVFTNIDSAVVL